MAALTAAEPSGVFIIAGGLHDRSDVKTGKKKTTQVPAKKKKIGLSMPFTARQAVSAITSLVCASTNSFYLLISLGCMHTQSISVGPLPL